MNTALLFFANTTLLLLRQKSGCGFAAMGKSFYCEYHLLVTAAKTQRRFHGGRAKPAPMSETRQTINLSGSAPYMVIGASVGYIACSLCHIA